MSSEIKIFKLTGKYSKIHQHFAFTKYVRALTEAQAKEKVLAEITSSKLRRRSVVFTEITTVKPEDCPNLYIKSLCELQ